MGMVEEMHDWVGGFEDFEGVLRCTHTLPTAWDAGAIIRAFETFTFNYTNDADALRFSHKESGIFVKYDGNVVAIEFGHSDLKEGLYDLFHALHALGWRQAEVFHPLATMDELLGDIGSAIPANLDFDVRPATINKSVGSIAERAQAESLFGMPGAHSNAMNSNLPAFEAIGDDNLFAGDEIELATDFLPLGRAKDTAIDHESLFGEIPQQARAQASAAFETPQVDFNVSHGATSEADAENFNQFAAEQIEYPHSKPEVSALFSEEPAPDFDPAVFAGDKVSSQELFTHNEVKKGGDMPAAVIQHTPAVIKVGKSFFGFDRPDSRITDDQIAKISAMPDAQIVHLYPGAINPEIRWEFLDEIGDNPWFAETLSATMVPATECAFVASMLLSIHKRKVPHGLRDVLLTATAERSCVVELLSECGLSNMSELRVDMIVDSLMARLGALALIEKGAAFVDIDEADEQAKSIQELFSLREAAYSDAARVFVVHISELDSPFVVWLADTMQHIAQIYSSVKPVEKACVEKQQGPSQAAVNERVIEILGPVFAQFKAAGVDLSALVKG